MSGSTDIAPGVVIGGDYTVVRKLAEGGMGAVFVVRQASTGSLRALKVIRGDFRDDPESHERFSREARISSRIKSDHVVQVLAAGAEANLELKYLVMELLEGETLAARVTRVGPLDVATIRTFARQICHGLAAAHSMGIVHRDLKPENIFLSDGRRVGEAVLVKILDFGIAKLLSDAQTSTRPLGTPAWLAPEQTDRKSHVGPGTDVWAFGLIVFYMLTARMYWLSGNDDQSGLAELMREVLINPLDRASVRARELQVPEPLPKGFDAWFERAVVREQAARFPSIIAATDALEEVLDGSTQVQSTGPLAASSGPLAASASPVVATPPVPHHPTTPLHLAAPIGTSPRAGSVLPQTPLAIDTPPPLLSSPPPIAVSGTAPTPPRPKVDRWHRSRAPIVIALALPIVAGAVATGVWFALRADDPPTRSPARSTRSASAPLASASTGALGSARSKATPLANPWHKVPGAGVELQEHEVTFAEYALTEGDVDDPNAATVPVAGLGHTTAAHYCAAIGARLPTEDEWRKASQPLEAKPPPTDGSVGPIQRNAEDVAFGLHDIWGNVLEFTSTAFDDELAAGPSRWVVLGANPAHPESLGRYGFGDDGVDGRPLAPVARFDRPAIVLPLTDELERGLKDCAKKGSFALRFNFGRDATDHVAVVSSTFSNTCDRPFRGYDWSAVLPGDVSGERDVTVALEAPTFGYDQIGFRCARDAK